MKVGRDEKRRQKVRRLPPSSLLLFSVSRPAGTDVPHCKQTTQIIKAPLDQRQDAKQNEMFESCRASFASRFSLLVARLDLRLLDRDAALISTDAKDLKVSFGISHHG